MSFRRVDLCSLTGGIVYGETQLCCWWVHNDLPASRRSHSSKPDLLCRVGCQIILKYKKHKMVLSRSLLNLCHLHLFDSIRCSIPSSHQLTLLVFILTTRHHPCPHSSSRSHSLCLYLNPQTHRHVYNCTYV